MIEKNVLAILEIAKSGSFSGAARQLYLSPQALMKQISKVEDEIGFPIFNRTSRGVTMTAAGEKLITYLKQRQEDQYTMLERCRAASTSQGLLRLALCSNVLHLNFSSVFMTFRKGNPDVLLHFVHCRPDHLFSDLRGLKIDCFLYPRKPDLAEDLAFYPLSSTQHYCIVESTHPLAKKAQISYQDLVGYPLFVATLNRNPHVMAKFAENNLIPQATAFPPIFVCYEGGVYIVFMKIDALPTGLVQIPLECDFSDMTGIICRRNPSALLKRFIDVSQKIQAEV